MAHPFLSGDSENIWMDKWRAHEAERNFVAHKYGTNNFKSGDSAKQITTSSRTSTHIKGGSSSTLIKEIEQARQQIQKSLKSDLGVTHAAGDGALQAKIGKLEAENKRLSGAVDDLRLVVKNLENRIIALESGSRSTAPAAKPQVDNKKIEKQKKEEDDDDDDIDLFGSDDEEEDDEAQKLREERLKQYADKKSKKPTLIAKSNIILDVKPWDDETDMAELEAQVRKITMDGLLWGASKLVPVGYGIKKLQISCVVEDDKVSTDDLEDEIVGIEDYVQSMDIAAFNKV